MRRTGITRRMVMGVLGASGLGAGLAGSTSEPLNAQRSSVSSRPIIDTHIHMWKLPRILPPMSDFGNYPGDPTDGFCCSVTPSNPSGIIPWLQQDALIPNYLSNWGGRRVSQ